MTLPTRESIAELALKYETLVRWSRDRHAGREEPDKETYRAMATKFPGALRELELLSVAALEARRDAVARVVAGQSPVEPWMQCLLAYHRWMRAALWVRARRTTRATDLAGLARDASAAHEITADEAFVAGILAPRGGRMRPLVIDRVARECEMIRSAVEEVVVAPAANMNDVDDTNDKC